MSEEKKYIEFEHQKEVISLKYALKTKFEEMIHNNIMKEVELISKKKVTARFR